MPGTDRLTDHEAGARPVRVRGCVGLVAAILVVSACTSEVDSTVSPTVPITDSTTIVTTGNTDAVTVPTDPSTPAEPLSPEPVSPPIDPSLLPGPLQGATVRQRDTISLAEGSSITSDGAVINGERDLYRFGATGGASLTVTITSVEDNAVFEIYAPDESLVIGDSTSFSITPLPSDGTFQIVVGPTRGNATYAITFEVG